MPRRALKEYQRENGARKLLKTYNFRDILHVHVEYEMLTRF